MTPAKRYERYVISVFGFAILVLIGMNQAGWRIPLGRLRSDMPEVWIGVIDEGWPVALVMLATLLYRTVVWKLLDRTHFVDGSWLGVSQYEPSLRVEEHYDSASAVSPPPVITCVTLKQSMWGICTLSTKTVVPQDSGLRWHSLACNIDRSQAAPTLNMMYEVTSPLNETVYGVEVIELGASAHSGHVFRAPWVATPTAMQSHFQHAWSGRHEQVLFRGRCAYIKIPRKHERQVLIILRDTDTQKTLSDLTDLLSLNDHPVFARAFAQATDSLRELGLCRTQKAEHE